jgi:hypothetical protein
MPVVVCVPATLPSPLFHVLLANPHSASILSSAALTDETYSMSDIRKDHVIEARYVHPSRLYLRFADGVQGTWTFQNLKLDMSTMKAATIRVSDSATVEVESRWGDNVQLDSSALRVLIDPEYAAEIEEALNLLTTPH